ncbi:hypothetical protein BZG01_10590 [Labilibaculum manganireducens]|uniref:F5/8 type C domain-containing protein n=1 Tax=Labilibaculum manganireducens TaxID=1940525 RepID=A0A2N3I841_9BACT|nr:DUF3472 domain-containing protein [Labilibaculum manganireducens]PKQ66468.1 hypothetical protein BZG01_10590 [Labilibaculum manganireducens]
MKIKIYSKLILLLLTQCLWACSSCSKLDSDAKTNDEALLSELKIIVPLSGNAWLVDDISLNESMISDQGLKNWTKETSLIRTFVRVDATGELCLGLNAKALKGSSKVKVTIGDESKEIAIHKQEMGVIPVGCFNVSQKGYVQIDIQGISKTDSHFGEVSQLLIGGEAIAAGTYFVKDDFYWGRRGPSVHLGYEIPSDAGDIEWFYNEIEVPEGNDLVGSYYMANGFGEGYFGIQVNSETERRILFSVWSSFKTDNPNDIPEDEKIKLLRKGADVKTGEFGNEGSGGQSYRIYDWKAGNRYRFLLGAKPTNDNCTDYTAYFFAPEIGNWELIASFRRPKTSTYLTRPHSFLENFMTEMGQFTRKGTYLNQWVRNTEGTWFEMTKATFTTDATGSNGARLDYDGGKEGDHFYLRNCGFFSDNETSNTSFTRTANGTAPAIDFSKLEIPSISTQTLMDRTGWTIVDFSTQEDQGGEGDTGRAADVLDGDENTYWHSCWSGCTAAAPHHITVDMGQANTVNGFCFTQRQNLSRTVQDLEIQISDDNASWESLGDFVLEKATNQQTIELNTAKTFRYFKFIAKVSHDGTDNAAMAEIAAFIAE